MRAFRLSDLVFMMRELQILSPTVDIKMVAEQRTRHRRALDVPTWSPGAPWARPRRLARFRVLPQHEIERVALRQVNLNALACAQIVQRLTGQLAVAGKIAYRIVNIAAGRNVSELFLFEQSDNVLHLRNVLRRPW